MPAAAPNVEDLKKLSGKQQEILIEVRFYSFVVFINLRKEKHYGDLNYDFLQKSVDMSTMSFHKLMRTMYNRDAINGWGGILALIYITEQPVARS